MLVLRNLNQGKIRFELEAQNKLVEKSIINFLDKFSTSLLHKIFSENLNREKYPLLETNNLYIEQIRTTNDLLWLFVFVADKDTEGIHLLNDPQWYPDYDFYKEIIRYERFKGKVIYGCVLTSDELFPLRQDKIDELVQAYLQINNAS